MSPRINFSNFVVLFIFLFGMSACQEEKLFTLLEPQNTGVKFTNTITTNDSMNILDYEYLYNGGGVGIGDFNKDGLPDLYFTGNMVSNHLYLNKGDMVFEDITSISGTGIEEKWSSGVSIVDINHDGWEDIYVNHNTLEDSEKRKNSLLVHQGLNEDGVPVFKDMAAEYGVNDDSYNVNSAFFDYDLDGDLDMITVINEMQESRYPSQYRSKKKKTSYERIDKLFRNDFSDSLGHPVFTNVSEEAGINIPGFSLGLNITDINKDGYPDIYITNDFLSMDILYINQKDGTFKDQAQDYFKHTSFSAMGNDIIDLNNDGFPEVIALDMLPEENYRQKKLLGPANYNSYLSNELYGYMYQFIRNTVQLNNGIIAGDSAVFFSDISLYSGLAATEWSWTPLVADFDNDGLRDVIVTNGFPMDVTDMDFIDYKADNFRYAPKDVMLSKVPAIKSKNCAFENQDGLSFNNVTDTWGFEESTYSNGAAYADLDNDGDLDVIINNIDDPAYIYQNNAGKKKEDGNFLQLALEGGLKNKKAFGAQVTLRSGDNIWFYENTPFRGYLSSHQSTIHFGLGEAKVVDIKIQWPDGSMSEYKDISSNQKIKLKKSDPISPLSTSHEPSIFNETSDFHFKHNELDFIDYNFQPLLPHKLSEYGPSLATGDVNNDGREDIYVSGSAFYKGYFLLSDQEGYKVDSFDVNDPLMEEMGSILFDVEGDGDLDLFIASGSYEFAPEDDILVDRLFLNEDGNFTYVPDALPAIKVSSGTARAADFDGDGDLDVFVGGRTIQDGYPLPVTSILYINESSEGEVKFSSAEEDVLPGIQNLGMVTDALWTDIDNDNDVDLMVVAEYQPIMIFENKGGVFSRLNTNLDDIKGWWYSIHGCDIDGDGDTDYVMGNAGKNLFYEIDKDHPYRLYVKDFDKNGSMDMLPFAFYKDIDGNRIQVPTVSRNEFINELNSARKKFPSYESYATATLESIITDTTLAKTDVYEVNYTSNSVLYNEGNGQWRLKSLPALAQLGPVFGVQSLDYDQDGRLDLLLIGNDHGNEIFYGRMDALNGLLLRGTEEGFQPVSVAQSGFYVPGNGKSLTKVVHEDKMSFIASENNGLIRSFETNNPSRSINLSTLDCKVCFTLGGQELCKEGYYGNGYLSQSSRIVLIPIEATDVKIIRYDGSERSLREKPTQ